MSSKKMLLIIRQLIILKFSWENIPGSLHRVLFCKWLQFKDKLVECYLFEEKASFCQTSVDQIYRDLGRKLDTMGGWERLEPPCWVCLPGTVDLISGSISSPWGVTVACVLLNPQLNDRPFYCAVTFSSLIDFHWLGFLWCVARISVTWCVTVDPPSGNEWTYCVTTTSHWFVVHCSMLCYIQLLVSKLVFNKLLHFKAQIWILLF